MKEKKKDKRKNIILTIIFGFLSLSAYIVLFSNQKLVTEYYTRGGWNTLFPIGTAFLFSFIHGAFASNLLSSIGLEAKKNNLDQKQATSE